MIAPENSTEQHLLRSSQVGNLANEIHGHGTTLNVAKPDVDDGAESFPEDLHTASSEQDPCEIGEIIGTTVATDVRIENTVAPTCDFGGFRPAEHVNNGATIGAVDGTSEIVASTSEACLSISESNIEELGDLGVTQSSPDADIAADDVFLSTNKVVDDFFVESHDIETNTLEEISNGVSPVSSAFENSPVDPENSNHLIATDQVNSIGLKVQSINGGAILSEEDDKFCNHCEFNEQAQEGQLIAPALPSDANFGGGEKPTQGSAHAAHMTDNEFSDFDDITNCPIVEITNTNGFEKPSIDTKACPSDDGDDDDDFGDFNDAHVEQIPSEEHQGPQKDFGDFTDLNERTDSSLPTLIATSELSIDECKAFGDFGDLVEETTDFPPIPDDPILIQAKTILSRVFNSHINQADDAKFEESFPPIVFVKDILATLSSPKLNDMPLWSVGALNDVLNDIDMLGVSGPTVIFDERAVLPYAHYSLEPGSFDQADCFAKQKIIKSQLLVLSNTTLQEAQVTQTVSVQPIEAGTTVSTSPILAQRDSTQSPVKLDFTDFKPIEEKENGGIAIESCHSSEPNVAKLFLQKIPDLSFMLSTSLSLPT